MQLSIVTFSGNDIEYSTTIYTEILRDPCEAENATASREVSR